MGTEPRNVITANGCVRPLAMTSLRQWRTAVENRKLLSADPGAVVDVKLPLFGLRLALVCSRHRAHITPGRGHGGYLPADSREQRLLCGLSASCNVEPTGGRTNSSSRLLMRCQSEKTYHLSLSSTEDVFSTCRLFKFAPQHAQSC